MSKQITVREFIGLQEVAAVVDGAIATCFDDDGNYISWVKDFAVRQAIVRAYTDAHIPTDTAELFDYVYRSSVYDTVWAAANSNQLNAICAAIDEGVRVRIDKDNNSTKRGIEMLVALMQLLSTQMNEFSAGIAELTNGDISELAAELRRSSEIVSGGIDDIRAAVR